MSDYARDWTDFPQGEQLLAGTIQARVDADGAISKTCLGVTVDDGDEAVYFSFDAALTTAEETALDALIAAYADETLAEAKGRCACDVKCYLAAKMQDGSTSSIASEITACDTALSNIAAAADVAAAEAARDAYIGG